MLNHVLEEARFSEGLGSDAKAVQSASVPRSKLLTRFSLVSAAAVTLLSACGFVPGFGSATEGDKRLCEAFEVVYVREIETATFFVNNQPALEGSRAGFDAAMAFGYAADEIASAARTAAESASRRGKELFSELADAHADAALAVAMRGGSLGPSEIQKIDAMVRTAENISEFCGG